MSVTTTTKKRRQKGQENKTTTQKTFNGKYAKEFTFAVQVGVEASSSNLHMARAREVPY